MGGVGTWSFDVIAVEDEKDARQRFLWFWKKKLSIHLFYVESLIHNVTRDCDLVLIKYISIRNTFFKSEQN